MGSDKSRAGRAEHYRRLMALREADQSTTVAAFCRKHGMSAWTYYEWRRRLAVKPTRREVGRRAFVAVRLPGPAIPSPRGALELVFPSGVVARFGDGYAQRELDVVIAAVGGARCSG